MTGKMTPEKARELRDEVRKGHPRHHPAPYAPQPETQKRRQLLFSAVPPDQASQAGSLLEGLEGMQTHRSWWVARDAVESVRRDGDRIVLALKGGAEAPVSRPNVKPLREAGWL